VGNAPTDIILADLDGDGRTDFVTANVNASSLTVGWNDGSYSFSPLTVAVAAQTSVVGVGDFDGDGRLDLAGLVGSNAGGMSVRLNEGFRSFTGSRLDRASLSSFTSSLIGRYINAVSMGRAEDGSPVAVVDRHTEREVQLLNGLTWYYVINSPALMSQRFGQRTLIRSLFGTLREAAESGRDVQIFPPFYREMLEAAPDHEERLRVVADYIASMSEGQVIDMHQRLNGQSLGSGLERMQ